MANPTQEFPPAGYLNPKQVKGLLGTFWNQMFTDKAFITGLTTGRAEELAQKYYNLVEGLAELSANKIEPLHTEKWYPIVVERAKFNRIPFVFEQNNAVFGAQPENSFFAGQTFRFGQDKTPKQNIYAYALADTVPYIGCITNNLLKPTVTLINGVDFSISNNTIYFNTDIFAKAFREVAVSDATQFYVDESGQSVPNGAIVLWAHGAKIDNQILQNGFGNLFNVSVSSTEVGKRLVQLMAELKLVSPSINVLQALARAYLGEFSVIEDVEVVEDVFDDATAHVVITDRHVYRLPLETTVRADLQPGTVLHVGDGFTTTVKYFDNVSKPRWWAQDLGLTMNVTHQLALGNYDGMLYLKNQISIISCDSTGYVRLPVFGTDAAVQAFNNKMNAGGIAAVLGLTPGTATALNFVDFLFENFFKTNTAFMVFDVITESSAVVVKFLNAVQSLLPPHVWFLYQIKLNLPAEQYTYLNNAYVLNYTTGTTTVGADASNSSGTIASLDPYFYKDLIGRNFALSRGPTGGVADEILTGNATSGARSKDGRPIREIPIGSTTVQVRSIDLLRFD